jgi:hypothetical protein
MAVTDHVKAVLEALSGIAALTAAYYWRAASKQPVATHDPPHYDVTYEMLAPLNKQIQLGAKLNGRAATWAAIAAIFQAFALLVPLAPLTMIFGQR